jgi:CubicO group peptidase (beta-lactamase class C family)
MSRLAIARSAPLFCVAGAFACAGFARPERVYLDRVMAPEPVAAELDRSMQAFAAEGFTGTVLVARGGRVLLYKGYGDANRARHLPNTAETKYPFGALANQFTAAGILQLESEGKLQLDAPAATWLGHEAGDVTLAQLLTRSREVEGAPTGIRPARSTGSVESPEVERFRTAGPSYALLERVLTAVTGRSLHDVRQERLFGPGQVSRTVYDDGLLGDSLVARGYTGPYGSTVVVTGLVGPLADLFHWHQALHAGAVLPTKARERMFTPAENGYGLGWVVGRTANGVAIIEHASDQPGFQLWYGYVPSDNVLVLLAANNDLGFRRPVADRLTAILTGGAREAERGVTKEERIGGK